MGVELTDKMASGGSAHRITNDGNDHLFRERAADQYKKSTEYKKRIQPYLYVSAGLVLVSSTYASLWHHKVDKDGWTFPPWACLWLLGLLPVGLGIKSLKRNNAVEMRMCINGIFAFIFTGMAWGIYDNIHDVIHLIQEGTAHKDMQLVTSYEIPSVIPLFCLISLSLAAHGTVVGYGKKLCAAWKMKGSTEKERRNFKICYIHRE